ncbi:iron-containing redox enzyme family protein [Streptomyces sp. NPDC020667]|uniref:iron-containing redox enzyme family protein n=1 Tax=Streptomyces sp. NPDC020667 TaxID=3154895 RepID=UPI0033E8A7D6
MTTKNTGFRTRVDAYLDLCIKDFYETIPFARHQLETKEIDLAYYKRHNIETILRLRRKRTLDALALRHWTKTDPATAKKWAHYTEDEMLHDVLFAADLAKVGVTKEEIYATEPLLSTKLLTGYLQYGLEYEDSPLALVASVYFVEYTTTRTQPSWLDNLEKTLGRDKIKGQRAHVGTDLDDDHDDFVWDVLAGLVRTPDDERRTLAHLKDIYQLWQLYFLELYRLTVDPSRRLDLPAPVEA